MKIRTLSFLLSMVFAVTAYASSTSSESSGPSGSGPDDSSVETKKTDVITVPVKQDEPDFPDLKRKVYRELHPHWGVMLSGSPAALGTQQFGQASRPIGISTSVEYEPEWFQKYGVLSYGISFNSYPVIPLNTDVPNAESVWSAGAQVRYQARFSSGQIIVPEVGLLYERLQYQLVAEGDGGFGLVGGLFGASLFLNVLDPYSEAEFYYNTGVLRTYLVAEGRTLSGSDQNLQISGLSWFFGIRIEY
jgi:hypothetical protein